MVKNDQMRELMGFGGRESSSVIPPIALLGYQFQEAQVYLLSLGHHLDKCPKPKAQIHLFSGLREQSRSISCYRI